MRLIDADALNERFEKQKMKAQHLSDVVQIIAIQAIIDTQPTIDLTEIEDEDFMEGK